jgi:glycosyltransferase involved in cell wall biosynthesis
MYPQPETPAFAVFVEDQVRSLRELGVEVDVLFMNGRRNKLNYLLGYPRLWRQLRRQRYDVIHAHYVFSGLVARAALGTPVILTHHGPEVFMTWEKYFCRVTKGWFDKMIVVSQEMKDRLGVPDAYVIPCGVDMERFKPQDQAAARRQLGLPEEKKLVLWAGEFFRPEKRFEVVEEAMKIVAARDPNVELVLLSGRPHTTVPAYMNACDAFLLTSDGEGSPMVIKEAMSCNMPVVATAVGDVADVIGGVEGCFITTQDPNEVADKVLQALTFDKGVEARRERIRPMELSAIARRIIDVYEDALRDFGRAVPSAAQKVDQR